MEHISMKEHSTEEVWKPIPSTDGWYEASDQGRIRSWRLGGTQNVRRKTPRILQFKPNAKGYCSVGIYLPDSKRFTAKVHRLVLEAFGQMKPGHPVTRHLNGDATDNRLANLASGTYKDNESDKVRHGTRRRGARMHNAKLSAAQVREIRRRYADGGVTHQSLGDEFGLSQQHVANIINHKRWAHIREQVAA